jgi:hypothetical protein
VLAFTPEVESAMRWFRDTHRIVASFGGAYWERWALPGPGSVGEQDAQLMEALDLLLAIENELLAQRMGRRHE